jgi:ureidoglycolate lyase
MTAMPASKTATPITDPAQGADRLARHIDQEDGLIITAEPLTAAAFAPFGAVLEAAVEGRRQYFDAILGDERSAAKPRLWTSRVPIAERLPVPCETLEHHPCSSQTFIPMSVSRYLLALAPSLPDGSPDVLRMRAFIGHAGQGVTYRAGAWHHSILALDEPAVFAVLIWQDGGPRDEVFVPVSQPIWITVESSSAGAACAGVSAISSDTERSHHAEDGENLAAESTPK